MELLEPGSYSHGTLRPSDMADMFATFGTLTECATCTELAEQQFTAIQFIESSWKPQALENGYEELGWIVEESEYHVQNVHTPDGYYFGSIEGDGADFGIFAVQYA